MSHDCIGCGKPCHCDGDDVPTDFVIACTHDCERWENENTEDDDYEESESQAAGNGGGG